VHPAVSGVQVPQRGIGVQAREVLPHVDEQVSACGRRAVQVPERRYAHPRSLRGAGSGQRRRRHGMLSADAGAEAGRTAGTAGEREERGLFERGCRDPVGRGGARAG
jgi:hypothetical protein